MEANDCHTKIQPKRESEPLESRVSSSSISDEATNRCLDSEQDCEEFHRQQEHGTVCLMSQQIAKQKEYDSELPPPRTEQNSEITRLAKHEECVNKLPQQARHENDVKSCFLHQEMPETEECDFELPHCAREKNEEKIGLPSQQMAKPEKCIEIAHHKSMDDDQKIDFVGQAMHDPCDIKLSQHIREVIDEKNGFMDQQTDKHILCDTKLPQCFSEENGKKGESTLSHRKLGKYFFYDSPLSEETGVWIPISVPPLSESEHEEWARGFYPSGGYFPEGDIGWSQCTDEDKELTMWDVVVEMLLVARGKVSAFASGDIRRISWISSHLIEQAWKEMAETLTEANFCNTMEIVDAEPPKWLPDSASSACMLCNTRFHPIMCTRHHCRFCGGIFCGDCTRGRSLLPAKFHLRDPQRVCDVCCVRLESVQTYLMDQVSHAAQLPTHDVTDLSTLRSWVNFPWGQSMEDEIYKATNTIRGYNDKVGSLRPEKAIPDAILRHAKGLAILTIVKVGMMVTYNIGTGLVIARREDGSWSPPSAISSFGVGWGAQAGGELIDLIIVLRTNDAIKTFSGDLHLSVGAGLSAAVGIVGRVVEADVRAGDGGYAACYTYSCSKGAFVGCSLEGSIVTTRTRENSRFYGCQSINASGILLGSLPRPPAAAILYRALGDLYQKLEK
ncbi:SH3 domain-containing YSC84-like protein [Actinidia chinensis var. chinensis]|uniref:SH3 domain-containing YSC84-like protein n=1 Tax=Actinidia chinensis var. chinensis TaxID=1590841 RepID=A0A2R6PY14_ACTCC|nr:SH3 domain-containing YSC84-like protein [Actinidia chinensis var. chinensis]